MSAVTQRVVAWRGVQVEGYCFLQGLETPAANVSSKSECTSLKIRRTKTFPLGARSFDFRNQGRCAESLFARGPHCVYCVLTCAKMSPRAWIGCCQAAALTVNCTIQRSVMRRDAILVCRMRCYYEKEQEMRFSLTSHLSSRPLARLR